MSSKVDHRVNAVRTAAAVLVVLSHARALFFADFGDVSGATPLHRGWYLVTSLGHEAVLVFFVLSGYWVGGSTLSAFRRNRFDWRTYATARFTRLWLVVLPALLGTALLDGLGRGLFPASSVYLGSAAYSGVVPALPGDHDGPLVWLANVVFLQGLRFPTFQTNSPLWSLAYEFWYYALFPLVLAVLARGTRRRARLFLGVLVVGICLLIGSHALLMGAVWLLGVGVAELVRRGGRAARLTAGLSPRIGLALLVAALLAAKTAPLGEWGSVTVVALAAAALLVSLTTGGTPERPVSWPTRLLSGYAQRSFSLYAIHVPVLALLAAWWVPDADRRWQPSVASIAACLLAVGAVMVLAVGFAAVTEQQTDRVRRRISAGRAHVTSPRNGTGSSVTIAPLGAPAVIPAEPEVPDTSQGPAGTQVAGRLSIQ